MLFPNIIIVLLAYSTVSSLWTLEDDTFFSSYWVEKRVDIGLKLTI
jgi:hypothetical protein